MKEKHFNLNIMIISNQEIATKLQILEHGKIQTLEDIEDKQLEEGEGHLYSSKIQTRYFGIFIVYILFLIIGIRRTLGPLLVGGVLEAQFSLNFSIHLFFLFCFFFLFWYP